MLKIPKGLKKKKKGKKGKRKDDELFDPEELAELERYKKEKQQKEAEASDAGPSEGGESAPPEEEEEWKKFKALTSGVDDVLKKTQDELDRIKATSYYQKKPPGPSVPAETDKKAAPVAVTAAAVAQPTKGKWVGFEEGAFEELEQEEVDSAAKASGEGSGVDPFEAEKVEEEEEESEFEDDGDDLFDTSYVDVVASGEVKLAYVPDSPEKEDDFDPFDTSIVDKVIKVDPAEEKKKKLVSLGCAVEVLTGKLEKPIEVPAEIVKPQRRRPRPRDLLLGSFDEGPGLVVEDTDPEPVQRSILDDDPVYAEETSEILGLPPVTPLAEVKPISSPLPKAKPKESPQDKGIDLKTLVEEFIPSFGSEVVNDTPVPPITNQVEVDDLDDEFAALATESLHKTSEKSKPPKPPPPQVPPQLNTAPIDSDGDDFNLEDDPFDTSFAAQVLPGKFELKLIEKEILQENVNIVASDTQSRINEVLKNSELSAKVKSANEDETLHAKKDLLGGSTSDLSQLAQSPIAPKSLEDLDNNFACDDPFDTSVVDKVVAPGKTELKFLEKELLANPTPVPVLVNDDDDDFDPRADETFDKQPQRPDNLLVAGKRIAVPKVVAFNVSPADLLVVDQEENSKVSKPLTPYYPPAQNSQEAVKQVVADPFDTSYVTEASRPGKLELQILEKELASTTQINLKKSLSDDDFDPRGSDSNSTLENRSVQQTDNLNADILSGDVDTHTKLHTPVVPQKAFDESLQDIDPFDTSIATGLIPGKAEIKILETELIYSKPDPIIKPPTNITEELLRKNTQISSSRKLSVDYVLEQDSQEITVKPLTPVTAGSFEIDDGIDPFDTSAVENILPGKTEIKLLESELLS